MTFSLINAGDVEIVLPGNFPLQVAVGEIQAMQDVGIDRRDQHSAVGDADARIGPARAFRVVGIHHELPAVE